MYTDDPHSNPNAKLIKDVTEIDNSIFDMAKDSTGSNVGTGGMATKLTAAKIATYSGADMIIANANDFSVLYKILEDDFVGTKFHAQKNPNFVLENYIMETIG